MGTELLALAAFPVPLPQVGIALAVVSLAFGILFFMFAARYYIAIVAVLVSPGANSGNGKKDNGANEKQGNGANGIKRIGKRA